MDCLTSLLQPDTAPSGQAEPDAPVPPATFNFAADVLQRRVEDMAQAVAIIGVGADGAEDRWSFERVAQASGRLAAAMLEGGLVRGDRVLVFMPRIPLWQVAMTACLHIGVIPVPCVTQVSRQELAYRGRQCGARGAISSREFLERFEGIESSLVFRAARSGKVGWGGWDDLQGIIDSPRVAPAFATVDADAPALIYFTSGSSGPPKAVVHAARGIFVRSWQPWRQLGVKQGDVIWTTSDTGWTRAGSCLLFGPWFNRAAALIVEGTLRAEERPGMLEKYGVTIYGAVATELRQVMASVASPRLPRLRWTLSAGEAMTDDLASRWQAFSEAPLVVGYGQTETPTATLTDPRGPAVNGMIGRPMAGNHVTVVDEAGQEAPAGVEGDIVFDLADPGLLLGYWVDGGIVAAPRRGPWHLTGDRGWRDERGELYFIGRSDDVISSSGYRIGPTEVENALGAHPAVLECAVVGVPDALRGEAVKAFVVLQPGQQGSEALSQILKDHVKQLVAPYKYPRSIDFVDSLPRTASGKISRRLLRERKPVP